MSQPTVADMGLNTQPDFSFPEGKPFEGVVDAPTTVATPPAAAVQAADARSYRTGTLGALSEMAFNLSMPNAQNFLATLVAVFRGNDGMVNIDSQALTAMVARLEPEYRRALEGEFRSLRTQDISPKQIDLLNVISDAFKATSLQAPSPLAGTALGIGVAGEGVVVPANSVERLHMLTQRGGSAISPDAVRESQQTGEISRG